MFKIILDLSHLKFSDVFEFTKLDFYNLIIIPLSLL